MTSPGTSTPYVERPCCKLRLKGVESEVASVLGDLLRAELLWVQVTPYGIMGDRFQVEPTPDGYYRFGGHYFSPFEADDNLQGDDCWVGAQAGGFP